MSANATTPLTVYLSAPDAERMRDLAAAADRSVAAEIRQAIRQYLKKNERPARQSGSTEQRDADWLERATAEQIDHALDRGELDRLLGDRSVSRELAKRNRN